MVLLIERPAVAPAYNLLTCMRMNRLHTVSLLVCRTASKTSKSLRMHGTELRSRLSVHACNAHADREVAGGVGHYMPALPTKHMLGVMFSCHEGTYQS
jgi:hypothetical protein